jgi:hypothetical protein
LPVIKNDDRNICLHKYQYFTKATSSGGGGGVMTLICTWQEAKF